MAAQWTSVKRFVHKFRQTDSGCLPQMLLAGELPLLTLPFRSQVTFWKWFWRQRRRVGVECTVTFLSVCECVCVGKSPVCISTEEQWLPRFLTLNLSFSPTQPFTSTHPFWIRPTRLDWTGLERATHWPVLGRAVPLWDTLTVSGLVDTPLHMLTSILPGTDAGWCSGQPFHLT